MAFTFEMTTQHVTAPHVGMLHASASGGETCGHAKNTAKGHVVITSDDSCLPIIKYINGVDEKPALCGWGDNPSKYKDIVLLHLLGFILLWIEVQCSIDTMTWGYKAIIMGRHKKPHSLSTALWKWQKWHMQLYFQF